MPKYKVKQKRFLTPSVFELTLSPLNNFDTLNFKPGQYAAISFKNKQRPTPARCFSISSAPTQKQALQFVLRVKGRFTTTITGIPTGGEVNVIGPFGGFVLDPQLDKQATLLAGGIGVTPFMSMLREAMLKGSSQKISLIYSAQTQDDVAFAEELKKIDQNPNIDVAFAITKGPNEKFKDYITISGRVQAETLDRLISQQYATDTFFICGPSGFMKVIRDILKSRGVEERRIITEAFSQGGKNQSEKLLSWPANVYALSTICVVVGALAVMATDVVGSLPSQTDNSAAAGGFSTTQQVDKVVSDIPPTIAPTPAISTNSSTSSSSPSQSSPTVVRPRTIISPLPRTTVS